jgi:hypothetical protein
MQSPCLAIFKQSSPVLMDFLSLMTNALRTAYLTQCWPELWERRPMITTPISQVNAWGLSRIMYNQQYPQLILRSKAHYIALSRLSVLLTGLEQTRVLLAFIQSLWVPPSSRLVQPHFLLEIVLGYPVIPPLRLPKQSALLHLGTFQTLSHGDGAGNFLQCSQIIN